MSQLINKAILAAPEKYARRRDDEEEAAFRSNFQRDRDRIMYSKSFRRLNGKTQIFFPQSHDHVRNRLTHTLEVSQIARTTAKQLGLNSDLTEAISLGHDIGHTPFGHVGERILNHIMNGCHGISKHLVLEKNEKGFKHNLQGVRILHNINKIYENLRGTNVTNFTLWGIANHSKPLWDKCDFYEDGKCYINLDRGVRECEGSLSLEFYKKYNKHMQTTDKSDAWSFEGHVVRLADEIAQRHHDIEDAMYMKVLSKEIIINKIEEFLGEYFISEDKKLLENIKTSDSFTFSYMSKFIVGFYNRHLINNAKFEMDNFAKNYSVKTRKDFEKCYTSIDKKDYDSIICLPQEVSDADKKLKTFLYQCIINSHWAQRMDGKGSYIIKKLFQAYMTNPRQLHDSSIVSVFNLYNRKTGSYLNPSTISKEKLGDLRKQISSAALRDDRRFEKSLLRTICDHIAGMTDAFVLSEFSKLYGEKPI